MSVSDPPPLSAESDELSEDQRRRLPARDPEALGLLFDRWFDRVYAFVRRLVPDEHLAEDLTQDVFVQAYRAIEGYDPERELRPWIFTIAANKVRDHWRSRRHRESAAEASVERDGAAVLLPAADGAPDGSLRREETEALVRRAIAELPEGMRVTLVLRVYEEMSFEEIGRVLDRNEVAVRKRYSRALETLRTGLLAAQRPNLEGLA